MGRSQSEPKGLFEANKLIFVRAYQEAAKILDYLLSQGLYEDQFLLHLRRLELANKIGDLELLKGHYEELLAGNTQAAPLYLILRLFVDYFIETRPQDEIVAEFQALLAKGVSHPGAYYGIGLCMEGLGARDRARFNYEQCIKLEKNFYPAHFSLSQIYYQEGEEKLGEHHFSIFEGLAPYNVYGNFETHRRLADEFLSKQLFKEAALAISTLGSWWYDNKGFCPLELQIFESLSLAKIYVEAHEEAKARAQKNQALLLCTQALRLNEVDANGHIFIAKLLEEFGEPEWAFKFYRKLIRTSQVSLETIEEISRQFLRFGELDQAYELFREAYEAQPDREELKFGLLVADLRRNRIDVDRYLEARDQLLRYVGDPARTVETEGLISLCLGLYSGDSEIHGLSGDWFLTRGLEKEAKRHFDQMYQLDHKNPATLLRYLKVLIHQNYNDEAARLFSELDMSQLSKEHKEVARWLKSLLLSHNRQPQESLKYISQALETDPWNISYLVVEILGLSQMPEVIEELRSPDRVLLKLMEQDEEGLDWQAFDQKTAEFQTQHYYRICYSREKLRFLYSKADAAVLKRVVLAAQHFDPIRAIYDFLRLLNTNFDSPRIYISLGEFFFELWQLESAAMWLDQVLRIPELDQGLRAEALITLAEVLVWTKDGAKKAVEYARLSLELNLKDEWRALKTLSHGLLKLGELRESASYLESYKDDQSQADFEFLYLRGLFHLRNGQKEQAIKIWQPLLKLNSDNRKVFQIKQEIWNFVHESSPYFRGYGSVS